ncbi:MAG: alpha/beta fold hydrolase, partial [Anaerolineales bacterium]|nr:alpha/beta fold hydrolase [Anaerolineales bacterium]
HVLKMEDYVLDRMPRCLEVVQRITKQEDFSLIGYCMGGMFGLLYGAAFPRAHLKNLICIATPVDYTGLGLLRRWADPQWFDVDRIVEAYGNIPADMIRMSLEMLRPLDRFISYIRLWDSLWIEEYVYNWGIRYR